MGPEAAAIEEDAHGTDPRSEHPRRMAVRLSLLADHRDEAQGFELPQPPVACDDRDAVPAAQLRGGCLLLLGREEDARRVRIEDHASQDEGVPHGASGSASVAAPPGFVQLTGRGHARHLSTFAHACGHGIRIGTNA